MRIGFTGTQKGMWPFQKLKLRYLLTTANAKGYNEFAHGDCIGADQMAHDIAIELGYKIIIHPPINASKRAFCCENAYEVKDAKEYLDRNHDIVDSSDVMIATPEQDTEQVRSGTWATIRYAKKKKKKMIIIYATEIEIVKEK